MGDKVLRDFEINIFNLGSKKHEFDFQITDSFFAHYDYGPIDKGQGTCHLVMDKSDTMMALDFDLNIEVELQCDRSLRAFSHPIKSKEEIIIKFGDSDYSLSDDVFVIRKDSPSVNVADFIYEFITVAVPMKKLHPDLKDEDQPDLIYSGEPTDEASDVVDPRWEALKKLKGK